MKAIDLRDANFERMRERLTKNRYLILHELQAMRCGSTRQIARFTKIGLLTVRPRVTELCKMGLVECCGFLYGEGIYRARTLEEWEIWRMEELRLAESKQLKLI